MELEDQFELDLTRPILAGVCASVNDPQPMCRMSLKDLKKSIHMRDKAILLEKINVHSQ